MSRCLLCGSTDGREVFRFMRPEPAGATGRHTEELFGRAGRMVRCRGCGVVRQLDPPEVPYEDASDDEYLEESEGIRVTFRAVLDALERHTSAGRLLDVGSGPGFLVDEAQRRGWSAVGVEPSAWAVELAQRDGLDVRPGTLEDIELGDGSFDAIVAADVIEHVTDPIAFARRLHSLLAPGGIVFIATPNVESAVARLLRRWWWSVIPNHLWLFSPETLTLVVHEAGFRLVETDTHPKTFSVDYYAGRFGGYLPLLGRLARSVGRILGGKRRLVTPDFGDRLAVIARKPAPGSAPSAAS